MTNNKPASCYLCIVYLILYLPIIVLIAFSFNDANYSMQFKDFTLKWYGHLFSDRAIWISVFNSFLLGICSSTVATLSASFSAVYLHFYPIKGSNTIQRFIFLLIVIPDIILAVGFLLFFAITRINLGFFSLLISHITFSIPFCILVLQNRLKKIDNKLIMVSQDLGASEWFTFRNAVFPLIQTSCLSAWLLSFTLSFDDVLISYFTAGPEFQILPLYIYALIRTGIKPEINALCSIVFSFSVILVVAAYLLSNRKSNQRNTKKLSGL